MSKSGISIEEFKNAIATEYSSEIEVEWKGLPILVKHHLSLGEIIAFTDSVVSSCFMADTNEYIPEIKDFATRCSILQYYSNVQLPEDLDEKCEMIYSSDIISCVAQNIDAPQFNSMCAAIDKKIDSIVQSNIGALNQQMSEVVSGFKALEKQLSAAFDGIDNGTISKIANAVANGSFDEDKLVQAYSKKLNGENNVVQMPVKSEGE